MKISGFTFARNVSKLYYPIQESILSILPIVDEFIVVLGKGDEDDNTRVLIEQLNSDKIKIIDTVWDLNAFPNGTENAHQTDIAISHCSGDWLFYLQADEVVHEKYLPIIENRCKELLENKEVEGLLFNYTHFYGDYNHFVNSHGWYPNEIRIVRNKPDIHSFESAQSFRRISDFDGKSYRKYEGSHKLRVAKVDAHIYHYGWVRPPSYMQKKKKALDTIHKGEEKVSQRYKGLSEDFDYGPMKRIPLFKGTHPKVMEDKMNDFTWADQLNYDSIYTPNRPLFKHERVKYRLVTFLEQKILGGKHLFGFDNWELLDI